MKDDRTYLRHILEALTDVSAFLDGMMFAEFKEDQKTINAVIRSLEIVGEATTHLSDRFRNEYPDFPYREIVSMRNKLIHEYFGVKKDVVWKTCQEDIPPLKAIIEKILEEG